MKALLAALAFACGFVATPGVAAVLNYHATLSGAAEVPPNDSPGTGSATLVVDTVARTFLITTTFSDLLAPTTVAHIHGPTATPGAGIASVMTTLPSFPAFPVGVTAGSYSREFDTRAAATYSPAFVTASGGSVDGAEAAFLASLAAGSAYLNLHSEVFPAGEIRGFFTPAPIPLPAGLVLALTGLGALGALRVGRRSARPA